MRVELTTKIFVQGEHVGEVLALLRHFAQGRHEWVVSPIDTDTVADYLDSHAQGLAKGYSELARKAAVNHAAWSVADARPLVRIQPEELSDHVADLERPAIVAVENNRSDRCFLEVIAKVFGAPEILLAVKRDWLVIDNGGGLAGAGRRAKEERGKFRLIPRVAALFDSDRMVPASSEKAHALAERLRGHDILVHVLEFREAENYIPNRVLHTLKPYHLIHPRIDALKRLSHEQRGHFDMKRGFDKTSGVPDSQKVLFAGVPSQVIAKLGQGFGSDVIKQLGERADTLSETDFAGLGPDVCRELRSILEMLRKIV